MAVWLGASGSLECGGVASGELVSTWGEWVSTFPDLETHSANDMVSDTRRLENLAN